MDKKVEEMLNKAIADSQPVISKVISKLVLDEVNRHMPPYLPIGYEPIYTEFVQDGKP